jgi:hypothetical protein
MAYYTIHAEVTVPVEVIVAAESADDAVERFNQRSWVMVKRAAWDAAKARALGRIHETEHRELHLLDSTKVYDRRGRDES